MGDTTERTPYDEGFDAAVAELGSGQFGPEGAKERDLYPDSQDDRVEWEQGYDAAICAWRLGHDPADMARLHYRTPSILSTPMLVDHIARGLIRIKPDPRRT